MFKSPTTPRLVCVETTNYCNATCTFCPNNALSRSKAHMSQSLFEKIIEDCREFPLDAIEPFMQGDPFADPDILPRMEHIRRRIPNTKLRLYTNGFAMTPKRIDEMLGLGIDHLYLSVNTLDHDKYKAVMGLKLQRTLDNIEYLIQPHIKRRIANHFTFRMTRLADTTMQEQNDFIAYCKSRGARPFIVGLFNYKGDINSPLPVPKYGCEHINRLDILASGKVTLCCMDQDAEFSWGDVNTHSVLEVYQGRIAQRYRDMHRTGRRREIEPCGTCNLFWPDMRDVGPLGRVRNAVQTGLYFARHRPVGRRRPAKNAASPAEPPVQDPTTS